MIKLSSALFASALLVAPLSAQGADLTIWWTKGFYPAEEEGIRRVVEDFQKETGTSVDLSLYTQTDLPVKLLAALMADQPPDLAYSVGFGPHLQCWAYEGRLVDLDGIVEPIAGSIDPALLDAAYLPNGQTGRRTYYSLPIVWASIHIHVWRSLLEQAGIGTNEIPHDWSAFWDFFCDRVQPAVREATGRREIYGMGLPVSTAGTDTNDTNLGNS
jgi:multiple sugar transport system substrate-binding protein